MDREIIDVVKEEIKEAYPEWVYSIENLKPTI